LLVNTTILDPTGKVIAKIEENNWKVNQNLIFDRSFDDHSFEVINEYDKVVLQVLLHNNVVAFSAIMHTKDGDVVCILKPKLFEKTAMSLITIGEPSVYDIYNRLPEDDKTLNIEPIFKYPSN